MDTRARRRTAVVAIGAGLALAALIVAPQAGTAEPLVGAAGLQQAVAAGNGAAYLEMDGITTSSTTSSAPNHTGDIVLRSLDWSVTNSAATQTGSGQGQGAGKATFGEFTVVKQLDSSTPKLLSLVAAGTRVASARLFLVRTGAKGDQLEALQYDLSDVLVAGDAESTDGNGTETVKLDFAQIHVTYFAGTTAGNVFGWNVATNAKV